MYELDLSGSKIYSIEFITKFLKNFKFLKVLNLSDNEIDDDSLREIENLLN